MNLLRQREQLKGLVKMGAFTQRAAMEFAKSPVFIYQDNYKLGEAEFQWCRQNVCAGEENQIPVKLPFPVFTIINKWSEPHPDVSDQILRVWSSPYRFKDPKGKEATSLLTLNFCVAIDGIQGVMHMIFTGPRKDGCIVRNWRNGFPLPPGAKREMQSKIESAMQVPRTTLMRFAFDVLNPASVVVRVDAPRQEGRSVEWHLARRHYLILNRTQAVACREGKRGPTDAEIIRAAHWRRAHLRRLSSPKFRHKQGQLVFVKQAWVGPDEWSGLDGKIYKVEGIKNE